MIELVCFRQSVFAGSCKAAVKRYHEPRSMRIAFDEKLSRFFRPHRVAARWPVSDAVELFERFHSAIS